MKFLTQILIAGLFSHGAWAGLIPQSKAYSPPGINKGAPLVVALAGCTQDVNELENMTRLFELADQEKFNALLLAEPDGMKSCWEFWDADYDQSRGGSDLTNMVDIIDDTAAKYSAGRIFVMGMSSGAAQVANLAACYPEKFTGIAFHSGVSYGYASNLFAAYNEMNNGPDRSRLNTACRAADYKGAVMVIHGTADSRVNQVNAGAIALDFIDQDLDTDTQYIPRSGNIYDYEQKTWTDKKGTVRGMLLRIYGLDHAWSGSNDGQVWSDPKGPDATGLIWNFFKNFL